MVMEHDGNVTNTGRKDPLRILLSVTTDSRIGSDLRPRVQALDIYIVFLGNTVQFHSASVHQSE